MGGENTGYARFDPKRSCRESFGIKFEQGKEGTWVS